MRQDDTKQRILKEALKLFSTDGFESVSVEQIARAVGIKAPSLYHHYRSKQAIFDAIMEDSSKRYGEYTGQLSIHMRNAEQDVPVFAQITEDGLSEKVRHMFLYSLHDEVVSQLRRMMTIEQFRNPELAAMYTKRFVDNFTSYHAELFRFLMEAGKMRTEDPEVLALMYTAPIFTLIGVCDRQPERETECLQRLDAHIRLFFRTFHVSTGGA